MQNNQKKSELPDKRKKLCQATNIFHNVVKKEMAQLIDIAPMDLELLTHQ
jgi:hypothetical protein